MVTPEPPGPPKLKMSEPMRWSSAPLALARISAMLDRVALGLVPVERGLHGGALPASPPGSGDGRGAAALGLGRGRAVLPVQLLGRQVLVRQPRPSSPQPAAGGGQQDGGRRSRRAARGRGGVEHAPILEVRRVGALGARSVRVRHADAADARVDRVSPAGWRAHARVHRPRARPCGSGG